MRTQNERQALGRQHNEQLLEFERQHPFRYWGTVLFFGGLMGAALLYALHLLSTLPAPLVTP